MVLPRKLDPDAPGKAAKELARSLKSLVIDQDDAVDAIVDAYQIYTTGFQPSNKPVGNFLFLGPTGTGKTRTVEAVAEVLLGNEKAVTKIDCAEYQHSHEIAKLLGSPPGYLGHRETHPSLSQDKLNQYWTETVKISIVLFDEIEKASDALWNMLLGVLDKGQLTLGDNKKVDFTRSFIFMTSNLGSSAMSSIIRPNIGFAAGEATRRVSEDTGLAERLRVACVEAARKKFSPEFFNRLDNVVSFAPLSQRAIGKILDLELGHIQKRFDSNAFIKGVVMLEVTEKAKAFLATKGFDERYGGRYLQRALKKYLAKPLANLVDSGQIGVTSATELIVVEVEGDGLSFWKDPGGKMKEEATA